MAYLVSNAITDTRRMLNDYTTGIWTDEDIIAYINEAVNIIKNTIPIYFTTLVEISSGGSIEIENAYKNLFPLFASARCFEQDEQSNRATKQMNEFENRKFEMEAKIFDSDAYETLLIAADPYEYVIDDYFNVESEDEIPDLDE